MKFRTLFQVAFVSVAALSLAGCETMNQAANDTGDWFSRNNPFKSSGEETTASAVTTQNAAACPPVMAAEELKTLSQFSEERSPRAENNISTVTISNVSSTCKYTDKNIAVDLDITFDGALGPKSRVWNGGKPSFAYPYFVAITQADGKIVTKEVFGVTLSYDKNKSVTTQHEHMRQVIPAGSSPQQLVIGFQLTEAQLAYNRSLDGRQGMAADVVPASGSTPIIEKPVEKKPAKKVVKKKKKKVAPKHVVKEEKPAEAPAPAAEVAPAPAQAETPAPATDATAPAAETPPSPAPMTAPEVEAAPPAQPPSADQPATTPAPSETPPATDAAPTTPPETPAAQ